MVQPTCRPFLLGTSARVLRPKSVNPSPMVLRLKPLNPLASSVLHTRPPPLDTCHRRPRPAGHQVLWAPLNLHVLRLDSVNKITPMYTCACLCLRCHPPRLVTRPSGPSVQASHPPFHHSRFIGMTRLYLTFTPPSTTVFELHTCTTQAKRYVAHIAFAMVGLITTQPSSWITLTITHHKTKHKGTFQPCVRC
jgi:hypothetical protein